MFRILRGTTAKLASYAGLPGELAMDTETNELVLQTGMAGGVRFGAAPTVSYTPAVMSGTLLGTILVGRTSYPVYAPTAASGGGTSGSTVAFSSSLSSGTAIGTLTIDGVSTTLYAPEATAGSSVSFSPSVYSGTEIGTLTINGVSTKLYAPESAAGSAVSFLPSTYSGTEIGTLTINGVAYTLYAPAAPSSSGSAVSYTPTISSGVELGVLTIDGTPNYLYGPTVSYTPLQASGTQIGSLSVGGATYQLFIPETTVTYTAAQAGGTKIGTLTVNGKSADVYASLGSSTYTGTSPISVSGTTISHASSGVAAGTYGPTANVSSGSFVVPAVTVNATGHVTGITTRTITLPSSSTVDTSQFGKLAELNTWTQPNIIDGEYLQVRGTGGVVANYTSLTKGTAPSTSTGFGLTLQSGTGRGSSARVGNFYSIVETNNEVIGEIRAYTWASGSTESFAVRIVNSRANGTAAGSVSFCPNRTDSNMTLGKSTNLWNQIYCSNSTINTSDRRLKTDITDINSAVLDAWGELDWKVFRWLSSVQEKGEAAARFHTGMVAQDIQDVFLSHGLDATRFGFFCHDSWDAKPARVDEDGVELDPALEAGDRYSLRYIELLCIEAAYQRRRVAQLEAQLATLLNK